jgi:hypothetical protein
MRAHERCCTAASRLWNSVGVTNIVAWQSIDASIWLSSMRSDSTLSCETTPIAGRMSSYVSSCAARVGVAAGVGCGWG